MSSPRNRVRLERAINIRLGGEPGRQKNAPCHKNVTVVKGKQRVKWRGYNGRLERLRLWLMTTERRQIGGRDTLRGYWQRAALPR
jgi:hypothetical protein